MEITASGGEIAALDVDTIVVEVGEGTRRLSGPAAQVDTALGGTLAQMLRDDLLPTRAGETAIVPALGKLRARRVVVHGVGGADAQTLDALRTRTGNLARALRGMDARRVALSTQAASAIGDAEAVARTIAEGFALGAYRFDRHHTREQDRPRGRLESLTVVDPVPARLPEVQRGVERGRILADATNLARDLANEPANLMTPTIVAERAQAMASEAGLECTIIERAEAERLGMGSYLSVANGSEQPPKFIVLRYRAAGGARGGRGGRTVGLIGKGITFDTGGISLKPREGMERMKGDMSGAAAVIGAMQALAQLRPAVNVLGVAPCTENMPSGTATKPGDVVYAMNGTSIEVLNTDAEGRLVLADGLAYARQQGCAALIDVATLTGAISVALGNVRIGTFANNDRLYAEVERAAAAAGERLWRMPLDREYDDQIKSDVADIKNTGGQPAGSITAAKFLERFVGDTPWVHLDIAGVMHSDSEKGVLVKGSSGYPVRTLVHFVLGRSRE